MTVFADCAIELPLFDSAVKSAKLYISCRVSKILNSVSRGEAVLSKGRVSFLRTRSHSNSRSTFKKTETPNLEIILRFSFFKKAPPPVETTQGFPSNKRFIIRVSACRNIISPSRSKISEIVLLASLEISISVSANGTPKTVDSTFPTEVLPDPIIPTRTTVLRSDICIIPTLKISLPCAFNGAIITKIPVTNNDLRNPFQYDETYKNNYLSNNTYWNYFYWIGLSRTYVWFRFICRPHFS